MNVATTKSMVMDFIDAAIMPKFMSKQEAYEILEFVIEQCRSRLEALRDEMRDD